jgi:uncharacterized coiled-coil protein SlyX
LNPKKLKTKNMTTLQLKKSIGRSPWRFGFLLIPLMLVCLSFTPIARAVNPPPDGGYGNQNTAEGTDALFSLTTGVWNVAVGFQALHSDTTGTQNTATGYRALFLNTTGSKGTAYGSQALYNNNTGNNNVATGFNTLFSNTSGNNNTGNGFRTLTFNNGDDNTATGFNGLYNNRTGVENTATGSQALFKNFDASDNTGTGFQALFNNTTSTFNVAVGDFALASFNGTTAFDGANTALGSIALSAETSGEENTAVGRRALEFLTAGSENTAVGWRAGDNVITASGVVCIGSFTTGADVSNTTYIRNINTTSVNGAGTDFVTVNLSTGLLGHVSSSRRYKENIKPMDNASEALYRLKPVSYRYKKEIDPTQSLEYGLVAEDVANVNPNLAIRNGKGQIESVRYTAVNAMMLNEFLKEHRTVEDLKSTVAKQEAIIAQQQKGMEFLAASLKDQAAQIQKVSAQVEVNKPTPKVVLSNP